MAASARMIEHSESAGTTAAHGESGDQLVGVHGTNNTVSHGERDKELFPAWGIQGLPTGTCLISTMAGPVVVTCPEITSEK